MVERGVVICIPYREQVTKTRSMQKFLLLQGLKQVIHGARVTKSPVWCKVLLIRQNPSDGRRFNKGKLLNAAAQYALQWWGRDPKSLHLLFHDVDLLPSAELLQQYISLFPPVKTAIHFASVWKRYSYPGFCGGVIGMSADTFMCSHGFPNIAWGYGGEDDMLGARLRHAGVPVLTLESALHDRQRLQSCKYLDMETIAFAGKTKAALPTVAPRNSDQKVLHCPWRHELKRILPQQDTYEGTLWLEMARKGSDWLYDITIDISMTAVSPKACVLCLKPGDMDAPPKPTYAASPQGRPLPVTSIQWVPLSQNPFHDVFKGTLTKEELHKLDQYIQQIAKQ